MLMQCSTLPASVVVALPVVVLGILVDHETFLACLVLK